MATFYVTTEVTIERVYTVQARFADEAKQKALTGSYTSLEELETSEELQSVEKDEE